MAAVCCSQSGVCKRHEIARYLPDANGKPSNHVPIAQAEPVLFPRATPATAAALKVGLDVYVHSPLLLVPSFYMITGTVKGQSLWHSLEQLRSEWLTASFGTAVFWTPLCFLNFRFVPQHSRILVVSIGSFMHKAWLSHLSNRERHRARVHGVFNVA